MDCCTTPKTTAPNEISELAEKIVCAGKLAGFDVGKDLCLYRKQSGQWTAIIYNVSTVPHGVGNTPEEALKAYLDTLLTRTENEIATAESKTATKRGELERIKGS